MTCKAQEQIFQVSKVHKALKLNYMPESFQYNFRSQSGLVTEAYFRNGHWYLPKPCPDHRVAWPLTERVHNAKLTVRLMDDVTFYSIQRHSFTKEREISPLKDHATPASIYGPELLVFDLH